MLARGISEGVKGTGGAGGEDKERSGTGAALTPQRRALEGKRPSAGGSSELEEAVWLLGTTHALLRPYAPVMFGPLK